MPRRCRIRIVPLLFPLLARAMIVASPIAAQEPPASTAPAPRTFGPPERHTIELAADMGWTRYGSDVVRPDGGRFGFFFARHLTPRLAWTFDITCTGGTPAGAPADDSFTICTGSLGLQAEAMVTRRVRPYVRASAGQAQLDLLAELDVFDIDERGGATLAAIGSRFALGRTGRYGLRAEVAWARNDVLGGPATHRSIALGITGRLR